MFFIVCCCLFGFIKEVVDKVGINGKSGYVDYIEIIEKCCFIVKDDNDDFIEFLIWNNKVYVLKRGYMFSFWGGKWFRMSVVRWRGGFWDKEKIWIILDILEFI